MDEYQAVMQTHTSFQEALRKGRAVLVRVTYGHREQGTCYQWFPSRAIADDFVRDVLDADEKYFFHYVEEYGLTLTAECVARFINVHTPTVL